MDKRKRAGNFSTLEKNILADILPRYPIIEDKKKTSQIDVKKQKAWEEIMKEFNSDERVTHRTEVQLKNYWKSLKSVLKTSQAQNRRERFATGGGTASVIPDSAATGLLSLISSQQPLQGVCDDDQANSDVDLDVDEDSSCIEGKVSRKIKRCGPISNAREFHKRKLQYLAEEHELKLSILQEELMTKKEERMQRRIEHEAALRNLNSLYNHYNE